MKSTTTLTFVWRIASAHTISYFIAGIFALTVLNYDELFNTGSLSFMRTTDSAWVAAGIGLQLIRGLLMGVILYPFNSIFLNTNKGWVKFWLLTFGLSYILTIGATVGSFEGIVYTNIPLKTHLLGLPEIVLYNTLITVMLWIWYKKPHNIFNGISIILVSIIVLMSIMGVMSSLKII
jgi:hypothetical protein